ncbi:uncharacterized protein BDW70DRAFT_127190 [Aspergillus foveolatus]|uniref:uncharacterized protein n=1 Tax=Aspergillus foveolatus TaxID=210207 RepID=UPI003CCD7203
MALSEICLIEAAKVYLRLDLKIGKLIQCQVTSDTEKHVVGSAQLASGKHQAIWRIRLCTYRIFTESRYRLTAWNLETRDLGKRLRPGTAGDRFLSQTQETSDPRAGGVSLALTGPRAL